jgi:hypothetical protein
LLGAAAAGFLSIQPTSLDPAESSALASNTGARLDNADRAVQVSPAMAVRLGPSGGNVVDLAIGDDALFTLDVVEQSVRVFGLDGQDQQPTPETLLLRAGSAIGGTPRRVATPVAIQFVAGQRANQGVLLVLDQARSVVQVAQNRSTTLRPLQSSGSWRELGALGSDDIGRLFVLDSGSGRLLEFPHLVDQPQVLLDASLAPTLPFGKVAEIVGEADYVFLRLDDGTLRRVGPQGDESPVAIPTPDGRPAVVAGIATDRAGGLYVADTANARILQLSADGALVRQLRDPALAGLRQIQTSRDGRRLYGLVTSGVLVFDVPDTA